MFNNAHLAFSGSVRIPSAMNGLFTIRPSTRRVPYGKATSVAGPMARSVASVEYFMRTVLDACPADYDATALPFPFNSKLYEKTSGFKKLAFGYAKTDGHVHPTSGAIRAVDETVEALRSAGHEGTSSCTITLRHISLIALLFNWQSSSSIWFASSVPMISVSNFTPR
jgi:Asp-tRNA(Asn)/Glu-tRNA(Gln) amidotransferase A subunit family amidase